MTTRSQIRKKVAELIAPIFNETFSSYESAIDPDDLPAACVYFDEGEGEFISFGDSSDWVSDLVIDIYSVRAAGLTIDDTVDELGEQVEEKLKGTNLGGLVSLIKPTGFNYTRDDDKPIGMLSLTYQITYEG